MKRSLQMSLRLIKIILFAQFLILFSNAISAQESVADLSNYEYWPGNDFNSLQSVAQMKILGKEFGGYIVIKNMGDDVFRVNYTSEMGLTIFDMQISKDSTRVIHVIDNLNKQSLINKIGLIFKVLLLNYAYEEDKLKRVVDRNNSLYFKLLKEKWKYYYNPDNKLSRKQFKKGCKSVNIFFSDFQNGFPGEILIKESGIIRLSIHLSILKYKTL